MSNVMRRSFFFWMLLVGSILLAPLAKAADQYGYNNGFFLKSADDDFMLKMNALFQGRYTGQILDGAAANTSGFSVPFARLYYGGHAFGPEWKYHIMFDTATGVVAARDYYVSWMRSSSVNVMFGQFKVPYGFEFLVPEHEQQFATQTIVTTGGGFVPGREIGLNVSGGFMDKRWEYWLAMTNGLANGTGINSGQGAGDIDFRYTGRLTYNAIGNHGFWYTDMGKAKDAQMAISLGGYWNRIDTNADLAFDNTFGFTADIQYASNGFDIAGEYHLFYDEGNGDITNHGFTVQAGFFMNEAMEIAGRVGWLEPDTGGRTIEPSAVLNWYLHGHNAKVQVEYDAFILQDVPVGLTTDDFINHQGIVQLQFYI
jgi:hypothetical protein